MKAAIYARVSTVDQHVDNQLDELRRYAQARGWTVVQEYVDRGVSGAKDSRPALNRLLEAARRRHIDAVACWRLDRLGRSLKHLIAVLDELQALNVAFISLAEGIDMTTPSGKLQLHLLAAFSEFERARIQERVLAGLARARRQGKRLGRPPRPITARELRAVAGLSTRAAARELKVSPSQIHRARQGRANCLGGIDAVSQPVDAAAV